MEHQLPRLIRIFGGPQELARFAAQVGIGIFTTVVTRFLGDVAQDTIIPIYNHLRKRTQTEQKGKRVHQPKKQSASEPQPDTTSSPPAPTALSTADVSQPKDVSEPSPSSVSTESKMPGGNDPNSTGGNSGIFGKDDTDLSVRNGKGGTLVFRRVFEQDFGESVTYGDNTGLPTNLKNTGTSTLNWYVLPLDSALPMAIMPRQWEALMQLGRRVRVVSASVRAYGFTPYITTTKQNLSNVSTIQNSYCYYVVDHPRILPGYNVSSSHYSVGKSDLYGATTLSKYQITGEPHVKYATYETDSTHVHYNYDQMALDMFNHPNFACLKQTEELNVNWVNTAENEWFHTAVPWGTNFDQKFMTLNDPAFTSTQALCNGLSTRLMDPNVTWGGNPSTCVPSNKKFGSDNYKWERQTNGNPNVLFFENCQSGNAESVWKYNSADKAASYVDESPAMWSKDMMTLLPKHKHPPPRILLRAKALPEADSKIKWCFMAEYTCVVAFEPNVMGYLPLNLGDACPGWCGDNMFGMRTAPNGMYNDVTASDHYPTDSSALGLSYKGSYRYGNYGVNTDEFPECIAREDYLPYSFSVGDDIHVGIRRRRDDDEDDPPSCTDSVTRAFERVDAQIHRQMDECDGRPPPPPAPPVPPKRVRFNVNSQKDLFY